MSVIEEKCRDCRFFGPWEDPTIKFLGTCRRFPPVVAVHPVTGNPGFTAPSTSADWWCGEWRARETQ